MFNECKPSRKIGVVYRDYFGQGGAPSEIRRLVELSEETRVYVGPNHTTSAQKGCSLTELSEVDICYVFGYSSLLNVFVTIYLFFKNVHVELVPLWQVTRKLDYDNPFRVSTVPSVEKLEREGYSRPEESFISKKIHVIKRIIYRNTLGKLLVNLSNRVLFFSEFEKNEFSSIYSLKESGEISFSTSISGRPIGSDTLSLDTINILYWGRIDAYYKGLDEVILNFDRYLKATALESRIRIYICGPDYDNGKEIVLRMINELGLSPFVKILGEGDYTPGTIGLLGLADYTIVCPVWDGYNRSCRESVLLGTPFISRDTANMDRLASRYGVGVVFSDPKDLVGIYQNIEDSNLICDPDFDGAVGYLVGKPL